MSDIPRFDGLDAFKEDPRIEAMVGKAVDITQLLLNADFLLGEYMVDHLKAVNCLEVAHAMGLTAGQRIKMIIWNTGLDVDPDGDTQTFGLLLAVLHARANLGRQTGPKLLDELVAAYMRICRPDALKEDALGVDMFAGIRVAVTGHLSCAQAFLRNAVVEVSRDVGEEDNTGGNND